MFIQLFTSVFLVFSALSCKKEKAEINQMVNSNNNATDSSSTNDSLAKKTIKYLALGDSYTIGASVKENQNFPNQLLKRLNDNGIQSSEFKIIAQTGWTTYNLENAIDQANLESNYNLVSLLIGVNNQYQKIDVKSYRESFPLLLNKAIALASGDKSRVFVVSIPDYGYTPFGKNIQTNISPEIDLYNHINDSVSKSMGVKYYNITPISRDGLIKPNLVASDGLHPSEAMYKLWVDLFFDDIKLLF